MDPVGPIERATEPVIDAGAERRHVLWNITAIMTTRRCTRESIDSHSHLDGHDQAPCGATNDRSVFLTEFPGLRR